MTQGLVVRQDQDGCANLTLNRPDKLNALTLGMFEELDQHLADIERDTDRIGVVLLRGAGRCFSAGNDLSAPLGAQPAGHVNFHGAVIDRLSALPQPVVAAVHGFCYTGALELALAADIILTAESARFADTHSLWAMTPMWGMSQRLPRRVGRARAAEMMFRSQPVSGREAALIGLANACFSDDEFDAGVQAFVAPMVANSWFSHRNNKRLLRDSEGLPLAAGLAFETRSSPGLGPDAAARIASFGRK